MIIYFVVPVIFIVVLRNLSSLFPLGNNIKIFNIILTNCSKDQMDMCTKYTNDSVTDFLLLSAT